MKRAHLLIPVLLAGAISASSVPAVARGVHPNQWVCWEDRLVWVPDFIRNFIRPMNKCVAGVGSGGGGGGGGW